MKPRHEALLKALPKHNNKVVPAAIEAGYSRMYAEKRGKVLFNIAMKEQAKEIVERLEEKPLSIKETKQLMSEIVGMSRNDVMNRLKYIATQEKDLSSALKVLAPLAKEYNVILQEGEQQKTIVPTLNITMREPDNPHDRPHDREVIVIEGINKD